MDLSKKTIMVVDNGLFVSFARMLAKDFGHVYYSCPMWHSAMPRSQQVRVGTGFDDIEYVKFPLSVADKVDLWVFLDLHYADLQLYLEEHGARVWGARMGEELELYRWEFHNYLKSINLPVPNAERVVGFDKLRELLAKTKNKFVKTSFVRGDFETFKHESYTLSEPRLDEIEHNIGPAKGDYEFIVEDEVVDAVEVGYDGFTVDGQFSSHAMMAYEVKDVGMIGVALPYNKLAEPVRTINTALSPALKSYNYRGFLSTEIRYTKDKRPYFIDPCCRLGTPSNELLQELFNDWPQVLWDGAEGILHSPSVKSRFAVGAVIKSEWATNDWLALHFPPGLDDFVKLRYHCRIQDKDYVAPQTVGMPDVGMVVGSGNTLIEAVKQCKERADQIKGFQVEVGLSSLDKAIETIQKGESYGIKFGDDVIPSREQVRKVLS